MESCGSDGVKNCSTVEEVEAHFELLMRSKKKAGAQDRGVICQEFLASKEYVVDHVSPMASTSGSWRGCMINAQLMVVNLVTTSCNIQF